MAGGEIGSGATYADVAAFEAAVPDPLTEDFIGEHRDEETTLSTVTFDTETGGFLLKLTAKSGAEHNGNAYGNGARINYGSWNYLIFDETTDDDLARVEVSKLAIDASGAGNVGIRFDDLGATSCLINRCLIKGDSNALIGIRLQYYAEIATIRNCVVYGFGDGLGDAGIMLEPPWNFSGTWYIYNNTSVKNYDNFAQEYDSDGSFSGTITTRNNLAQGDTGGSDYRDDGAGFDSNGGATSKNISEDATSPDASYQSKDVHTNSVFENYASDDYRLDPDGDSTNLAIVDDGDDLSGTFTDDIQGQTRSTWYIGASEIVAAGGLSIPVAMRYYRNRRE